MSLSLVIYLLYINKKLNKIKYLFKIFYIYGLRIFVQCKYNLCIYIYILENDIKLKKYPTFF